LEVVMADMDAAIKAMQERIDNGPPFLFSDLYVVGNRAGNATGIPNCDSYRVADRMIQKARKAGKIKLVRTKGVGSVWHPVSRANQEKKA